jgi:hypothetical protein
MLKGNIKKFAAKRRLFTERGSNKGLEQAKRMRLREKRGVFPAIMVSASPPEDSFALQLQSAYRVHRRAVTMPDQENDIQKLENQFPPISGAVFAAARAEVLASGQSVLQSDQGVIYEIFPDGTRRRVKEIDPPTPVVRGSKIRIE